MRIGLVLVTYSRVDMMAYSMAALLKCRGLKKFPVYVAQDGGTEAVKGIAFMKKICDKNKWYLRVPKVRLGLPVNMATGINEAFEIHNLDAAILHVDDVIFSLDCLEFLSWALNKFKEDKTIFGVSAHSPLRVTGVDNEVAFRGKLNLFGGAMWRDNWEYYYRYWQREGYPAKKIWGTDACMDNVLKGCQKFVAYPTMARASHIGWYGTNVSREEAAARGWNKDTLWTRCPNFKEDHKVDKYKIINETRIDAVHELEARKVFVQGPWVENWRVT